MTRRTRLAVEALVDRCLPSLTPVAIPPTGPDPSDHDQTRILVRFRPEAAGDHRLPGPVGATVGRELPLVPGLHEVHLAAGTDVEAALGVFRADPRVAYAQPNYRLQAQLMPDDPGFGALYGMHNTGQTGGTPDADIDAPEAWDTWTGNGSTVIAVLDTGIDYNHPDLAGNLWTNPREVPGDGADNDLNGIIDDVYGANFVYRDPNGDPTGDPYDDFFHGTHVAGTLGAVGNNGIGVAGVSWNVKIMSIKFLDAWGSGWTSDAIAGLNYAVSMGAKISNNSWGGGAFDTGLRDAIAAAGARGHLFVAAAGNGATNADLNPMYPAAYDLDNIVSVAATNHADGLAGFSNYGPTSVDLGAPGVDVYSTFPTYETEAMWEYGLPTEYGWISGTSMATPHVAGVASLIRDRHPDWSAQQVRQELLETTDPVAALAGRTATGGRLNAAAAISDALRVRVRDATVVEGNSGPATASFEVYLTAPNAEPVTVAFATADGTATAGDYQARAGTLTFAPSEISQSIIVTVPVNGDRLAESNETFVVNLSGATNAVIGDGQGVGTITDDEPRLRIDDVSKAEGDKPQKTPFLFTVSLLASYDELVTVSFRTVNGSAGSGSDYVSRTGTLTFAPGDTSKTVTIEVKGDNKREANETFFVDLFGNSSNSILLDARGVGTILNDD